MENFKSQRDHALYLAKENLNNLLTENPNTSKILRVCYTVSSFMGDNENITWIDNELTGYYKELDDDPDDEEKEYLPDYRRFKGRAKDNRGVILDKITDCRIHDSIHRIEHNVKNKKNLLVQNDKMDRLHNVAPEWSYKILSSVQDRCLKFLIEIISKIEYSGSITSIIESMQTLVDSKLTKLNPDISVELQSITNNLSSDDPSDLSKVAHSCRRVLKLIADEVFPASNEAYKNSSGVSFSVKDNAYMNRLLAFIDTKNKSKMVEGEIKILASHFDKIRDLAGEGAHSNISKYETEKLSVHTYLIASEILQIMNLEKQKKSKTKT